jgi:hypothetical protein
VSTISLCLLHQTVVSVDKVNSSFCGSPMPEDSGTDLMWFQDLLMNLEHTSGNVYKPGLN